MDKFKKEAYDYVLPLPKEQPIPRYIGIQPSEIIEKDLKNKSASDENTDD